MEKNNISLMNERRLLAALATANKKLNKIAVEYYLRQLNSWSFFYLSVYEVLDWIEEHTPQHLKGIEEELRLIESNHADCTKKWKAETDTWNMNNVFINKMFYHPTFKAYRQKYQGTIGMRCVRNRRKYPYLAGYAAMLYNFGRLLSFSMRAIESGFNEDLHLAKLDVNVIKSVIADMGVTKALEEALTPITKVIDHFLTLCEMDETTFYEYVAYTDKQLGEYIVAYGSIPFKDLKRETEQLIQNERKAK